MCNFKAHFFAEAKEHEEHLYGFSPVCLRMCTVKTDFVADAKEHEEHLYGFSPVWVRI
jgi:hypothetical protein